MSGALPSSALALGLSAPPGTNQVAAVSGGQVVGVADSRYVLALDVAAAKAAWPVLKEHAIPAGLNAWRLRDIADGLPRVVAATQEQFIPQMVNFEAVGGVSFKKGCYPGQEIVARTEHRGEVKRRIRRFACGTGARPAAGDGIVDAAGAAAGEANRATAAGEVNRAAAAGEGFELLGVVGIDDPRGGWQLGDGRVLRPLAI